MTTASRESTTPAVANKRWLKRNPEKRSSASTSMATAQWILWPEGAFWARKRSRATVSSAPVGGGEFFIVTEVNHEVETRRVSFEVALLGCLGATFCDNCGLSPQKTAFGTKQ